MDRLVVSKSLTADMEGDAAGGVVDMVMKDAPSRFQLQANAAIGTTDYFGRMVAIISRLIETISPQSHLTRRMERL